MGERQRLKGGNFRKLPHGKKWKVPQKFDATPTDPPMTVSESGGRWGTPDYPNLRRTIRRDEKSGESLCCSRGTANTGCRCRSVPAVLGLVNLGTFVGPNSD
ncbi:hypothetical protein PCH_Pc22g06620 [Penicillium rubens Wisconsin 54-1255]|uniref:Uncharacterized protein n=1 Tax=Penicillium rubens (strain ATCC 28089 / DSM 1075 / NRRL 1951 / Wisconsin 54-1255) TaxID=500485 RepID=B6HPV2_PENRW|nr:hypothetical protein PCH_Pc22g06620 [Penicillium rubens Wisconsin 54-1255]